MSAAPAFMLTATPSASAISSRVAPAWRERPAPTRYYYDDYDNYQPAPFFPSELLVATLCLADPALAGHGEGLLAPMLGRAQGGEYANLYERQLLEEELAAT